MDNPPEPHDPEQHSAWLASLSPDEVLVVYTPPGYQMNFIIVALTKRALLMEEIKPGEQLELLENMNALTDRYFTAEMLSMIEPVSDTEYEIFAAAKMLDKPSDKCATASFKVLTSPRVFWHICTLNPSILAALRHEAQQRKAAALRLLADAADDTSPPPASPAWAPSFTPAQI
jgi:hypothetical protein